MVMMQSSPSTTTGRTTNSPRPRLWGGWRVALNIGRERFTTMPNSWASSGARFPLVMKCNFTDDGRVASISGDVRYTVAVEGEVVKPVDDGTWALSSSSSSSSKNNKRDLSFTLGFPEKMMRNGVEFGPCDITCEGLLYSINDLNALDQEFYKARSITDNANAQVKEAKQRKEAPKKWNFETNRWEKRYKDESIVATVGNRLKQFAAIMMEDAQSKKRPKPTELSLERGQFPGIDCDVYICKGGTVKMNGAVIGTWGAEPITDAPASYYRASY